MRREAAPPPRHDADGTPRQLAASQEVLGPPGRYAQVCKHGDTDMLGTRHVHFEARRDIAQAGGGAACAGLVVEHRGTRVAAKAVEGGAAEGEDLCLARAGKRRADEGHDDADIREIQRAPRDLHCGDKDAHVEPEAHLEDVVLEARITESVGVHVLVREVQGEVVQIYAADFLEVEPGHAHPDVHAAAPQRLGALGEDRPGRERCRDRHATFEGEGHAARGGAEREVGHGAADRRVEKCEYGLVAGLVGRDEVLAVKLGVDVEAERLAAAPECEEDRELVAERALCGKWRGAEVQQRDGERGEARQRASEL